MLLLRQVRILLLLGRFFNPRLLISGVLQLLDELPARAERVSHRRGGLPEQSLRLLARRGDNVEGRGEQPPLDLLLPRTTDRPRGAGEGVRGQGEEEGAVALRRPDRGAGVLQLLARDVLRGSTATGFRASRRSATRTRARGRCGSPITTTSRTSAPISR